MLLIGLLIAVAVAVFAGVVLSENWGGATYPINGFGHVLGHLTLAQIFISGLVLMALFAFGLWMASVSTRLHRRASGRRRAETRAVRDERESLLAERNQLASQLEAERANNPATAEEPPPAYPRDSEVYGTSRVVDPSNPDAAYSDNAKLEEERLEEERRHSV